MFAKPKQKPKTNAFTWPEWLNLNRVQTPPRIGVDIGSTSVKMVELRKGRSGAVEVGSVAAVSFGRGAIDEHGIQNVDGVANAIRQCWLKLNTPIKQVSLSLPPSQVITKTFRMSGGLTPTQQKMAAEKETANQLPFAIDEARWDWMPLEPMGKEPFDALLIAAVRDRVNERAGVIEAAGLKVATVDMETLALQHLIEHSKEAMGLPQELPYALVDVGQISLNFSVFKDARLVWSREIPFRRDELDLNWQSSMGLEDAEFRMARKSRALEWVQAGEPLIRRVAEEIEHGLRGFSPAAEEEDVQTVWLHGGGSLLPGLVEALQAVSMKRVALLPTFEGVVVPIQLAEQIQELGGVLAIATGLAMRRFDPAMSVEDLPT